MEVAYTKMEDTSLDRIAVVRILVDYICCHNLFKLLVIVF